jgi:16S rRNA (guanine966-N2)-methyltransferase
MKVLGGSLRGRTIELAPGIRSRPSTARLREALFSVLGARVEAAHWIDLFAGSGAFGIEALSRGAASCRFVEIDPRAVAKLKQNLAGLGIAADRAPVHRADARRWLARFVAGDARVDGIFADPPYQAEQPGLLLPPAVRLLESGRLACSVVEHARDAAPAELLDRLGGSIRRQTRSYGNSAFTLLERCP